jgi:hypothetical protein
MVDYKFLFLTNESFKFIKGYEKYMISDEGRVFSIKSHKFFKPSINTCGYYIVDLYKNGIRKNFTVHRLVGLHFLKNSENKKCIDHINNNKLDNTINNLRFATLNENSHNARIRNDNTSGIKGVYFHKQRNKYRAEIVINNKKKHIGYYKTLEEATIARKKVANKLFGEFTHSSEKY